VRWISLKFAKFASKKMIIKAAKRTLNFDKICRRSYSDLNFGVTFWNTEYIKRYINSAVNFSYLLTYLLLLCVKTKKTDFHEN